MAFLAPAGAAAAGGAGAGAAGAGAGAAGAGAGAAGAGAGAAGAAGAGAAGLTAAEMAAAASAGTPELAALGTGTATFAGGAGAAGNATTGSMFMDLFKSALEKAKKGKYDLTMQPQQRRSGGGPGLVAPPAPGGIPGQAFNISSAMPLAARLQMGERLTAPGGGDASALLMRLARGRM